MWAGLRLLFLKTISGESTTALNRQLHHEDVEKHSSSLNTFRISSRHWVLFARIKLPARLGDLCLRTLVALTRSYTYCTQLTECFPGFVMLNDSSHLGCVMEYLEAFISEDVVID